jgi:hypothetical protein
LAAILAAITARILIKIWVVAIGFSNLFRKIYLGDPYPRFVFIEHDGSYPDALGSIHNQYDF